MTSQRSGESLLTVIVAFAANLVIAAAKTVAATLTGSASMVAEAAHSWADTGNEVFLLIAERRAARPRDVAHPFGYGREAYVWSMFAAFGLFTVGAVVSIAHGVQQLGAAESDHENYLIGYVVLAVSFALEGASFLQALRQTRGEATRLGLRPLSYIGRTSNPTLPAVFVEDSAALVGLVIAAAGMALHQLTGDPVYDAVGSILVGLLLGVIAVFLIRRNREFLIGQVVRPQVRNSVLATLLEFPEIEAVTFPRVPQLVGIRAGLSEHRCLSTRFGGPGTAENGGHTTDRVGLVFTVGDAVGWWACTCGPRSGGTRTAASSGTCRWRTTGRSTGSPRLRSC